MLAIMSATPEENASVVSALEAPRSLELGRRRYHFGTFHGVEVAVVFSRWGKVAAAATATQLIAGFGATEIVFSGVAGAVHTDLKIGDIVVGTELLQHDMDATPIFARYEVPLLGATKFATAPQLRAELAAAAVAFLREDVTTQVGGPVLEEFGTRTRKVVEGAIASGDRFFSGSAQVAELRQRLPEVTCVDMEGAAVAQVCAEYGVPFGIVRTISDSADDNAVRDFPRFLADVAGHYSLGILTRLVRHACQRK
jgi:adenosylhomocysteine nucleosidase